MEGVLVSATKAGSTITVTVVTSADGRYSFPSDRLAPGKYTINVRAVGFELDPPGVIEVPEQKSATANLRLEKAKDLAAQLSNGEWMASIPGTDREKGQLFNCVGCHTVQRIVRSKYDTEGFLTGILPRMQSYVQQSLPIHPQLRPAERLMEEQGEDRIEIYRSVAKFLSTINLSATDQWKYELKTLPRPKGAATKVIYTEYDLPREEMAPHDVIVDRDGIVWFGNFGEQKLGRLDPKTGKVAEYPYLMHRDNAPTGSLGLRSDKRAISGSATCTRRRSSSSTGSQEKPQFWTLPAEQNIDAAQINMVSPQHSDVDGKVWTQKTALPACTASTSPPAKSRPGMPFKSAPKGEPHNIYDVIPDSQNNAFFTDFRQGQIGRIDAMTGEVALFQTPTPRSAPRRGNMDAQDRLWFGNIAGVPDRDVRHEKQGVQGVEARHAVVGAV